LTWSHRFARVRFYEDKAGSLNYPSPKAFDLEKYPRPRLISVQAKGMIKENGDWSLFNLLSRVKTEVSSDIVTKDRQHGSRVVSQQLASGTSSPQIGRSNVSDPLPLLSTSILLLLQGSPCPLLYSDHPALESLSESRRSSKLCYLTLRIPSR
jgi:hypothetical protein